MEQQERPDFTACPMWGQGGRYLYDPATGHRTRLADEPVALPEDAASEPTDLSAYRPHL